MDDNFASSEADLSDLKDEFPLLKRIGPGGEPVIYLDSAATALKPQCVIDTVSDILTNKTANIHRSVHTLGDEATQAYENTRNLVSAFINCDPNEVVFLRNTTEALNLIAHSKFGREKVLTTYGEHHSNFLPWSNDTIRLSVNQQGEIDLQQLDSALQQNDVSLVSVSHISNVTGGTNDIESIANIAHRHGAKLLVDAAQSAPHVPIDVDEIDCDFLAFSGHKLGAPTGVGVLFGKAELLEEMDFFLKGGSTIEEVDFHSIVPKNAPWKFEAGTPAIESVAGLGAAINFLLAIGMETIQNHFQSLSIHARNTIERELGLDCVLGNKEKEPGGPYSITLKGISPHVIARGLSDRYGIFVRSGFHCAQPLHKSLEAPASVRISHWLYNTEDDINNAVEGILALTNIVKR